MKRVLSIILCVLCLCSVFSISAFAERESNIKSLDLSVWMYDENGNATDSYKFATVYLEHGILTSDYDHAQNNAGQISIRNDLMLQDGTLYSCQYAYLIGLINSSTSSSHAIISVESEINNLNYFMEQKWNDPTNNYAFRTYLLAAQMLGTYCTYSIDFFGYADVPMDARNPETSFYFDKWFADMNKQFVEEWFTYYNEKYSDANGTAFYYCPFQAETWYDFECGERRNFILQYSRAVFYAKNLNIKGGLYVGESGDIIDFVLNTISSIRVDLWAAWMPSQILGVIVAWFSSLLALLTLLMTLKLIRG